MHVCEKVFKVLDKINPKTTNFIHIFTLYYILNVINDQNVKNNVLVNLNTE